MNVNQPSSGLQPRSARSKKNKTPAPPQMILVCFLALIIFGGLAYTLRLSPNSSEDLPQQTASGKEESAANGANKGGQAAADHAKESTGAEQSDSAPSVEGTDGTGAIGADAGEGDAPDGTGTASTGGTPEASASGTAGNATSSDGQAGSEAAESTDSAADEPKANGGTAVDEIEQAAVKPVDKPASTDYSKVALPYSYTVRKGDTLFRLSQLFYGSKSHVADIASRNKLSKDAELTAGSVIVIPALSKSQGGNTSSGNKPAASGATVVHTVKEGETLYSISRAYFGSNSYAKKIAAFNQLGDGDELKAGTKLKIPPKS
ncbi:LysM peptidoglycan-binding domain-containing protein [Paenibacillus aurantiacus]|uniref:LysM peptidoglycan-binding domain-containing protein n=1 Tax=Paenibacillus aurantiacus TaxID=1936118 RepID=A0ABV5KLX1_9BACL